MEHLDFEKMQAYIDKQLADKELEQVESHLAECSECLAEYTEIKSLEKTLNKSFKQERPSDLCPEEWEIASMINGEPPQETAEKIKAHIQDCDFCMERAVVYYKAMGVESAPVETPDEWKQKALKAIGDEKISIKKPEISIMDRLRDLVQGLSAPLPAFAGYAVAILAVGVLILTNMPEKDRFITIASSEKLTVRDSEIPSTFGFSGAGETRGISIMKLSYKGGNIVFEWKPIQGASEYEFSLTDRDGTVYAQGTPSEPVFSINKDIIDRERLYRWLITGKTSDEKYFEYTGDFISFK